MIVPISGKYGRIRWNSVELYLAQWDAEITLEVEDYATFGMTADVNNLIFKGKITGFVTGTANVAGKFDNTAGSYLPTNKFLWPGPDAGYTGFLGISQTVGFNITGIVQSLKPAQSTEPPYCPYAATIGLTAMVFNAAGP